MNKEKEDELGQECFELIFSIIKNNKILMDLSPEIKENPGFGEAFAELNRQLTTMLAGFEFNPNKAQAIHSFTLLIYDFIAQQQKIFKLRGIAENKFANRKRKQRLMSLAAIEYYLQKKLNEEEAEKSKPDFKKQFLALNENISDFLTSVFQTFETMILLVPELAGNKQHIERLNQIQDDFIETENRLKALQELKQYSNEARLLLKKLTLKPVADLARKLAEHRGSKQPARGLKP